MYRRKYKYDRILDRYKARLVAKGFTQQFGVDYVDTFIPMEKMTTIQMVLVVAAVRGFIVHQLDINNVFLHGDSEEEMYMSPPFGFV